MVTPPTETPTVRFPAAPPPAAPLASPPSENASGGFNWGLRPGGGTDAATPAAPPPLVEPSAAVPTAATPAAPPAPTAPYVPPVPASELTQPMSWTDFAATQAPASAPPAHVDQPTEAYTVAPWQPTPTASTVAAAQADYHDGHNPPTSAIDSLFGDHQFQEYEDLGVLKAAQTPTGPGTRSEAREPRAPLANSQKALMGIAGGLIGVLLLIGLFFLGEHLGAATAATPTASTTTGAKSTPTSAGSGGPAAPGVQQWSALQGGECIQPFSSAWAVTFTVVACTKDHDAEMVFKGRLSNADDTGYPSTTQFQTQLTALCSAPTAINYKAAASITDLQVSFSYPPSAQNWISGNRTYYCFVDRASGGTLPGDLSVQPSGN